MNTPLYDIYFRGEIADGYDLDTVKSNLAKIFQADEKKIASLFSGKTCLLKKEIDKESALKYQTVLKKAGAKIIIKASQVANKEATTPQQDESHQTPKQPSLKERLAAMEQSEAEKPAPTPAPEPDEPQEGLHLAPIGSELLKPTERKVVEAVEVNISELDLTAPNFEPPKIVKAEPPAPDVSNISVAEAGEDLLIEKAVELDLPFPDISQLDIDEVGVRLSEEKGDIPLPELDLSSISISEPGERLSKEDSTPPPSPPDTSHLTLDQ